jgi:hypothetical protein
MIQSGISKPLGDLFDRLGGPETKGWDLHRFDLVWALGQRWLGSAMSGQSPTTSEQKGRQEKKDRREDRSENKVTGNMDPVSPFGSGHLKSGLHGGHGDTIGGHHWTADADVAKVAQVVVFRSAAPDQKIQCNR